MILIPAAGDGSRFRQAGYTEPKHLIPLGGKPMIEWVLENTLAIGEGIIIVADKDMVGETKGAIDTVLKAWEYGKFSDDQYVPLVVANCDQLLQFPSDLEMKGDGIVFTFRSNNPAHSYVDTENDGGGNLDEKYSFIFNIVEKPEVPPTDRAVSGVYWFKEAGDFIEACREVTNSIEGEQYISSALACMLGWGYSLYAVDAPTAILGTPEDFQRFEVALSCAS